MKEKSKTKIICSIISGVTAVIGALAGAAYTVGEQNILIQKGVNVNIEGDNSSVTINDVNDLIKEYNKLLKENDKLEEQNSQYFSDYKDQKETNDKLKDQLSGTNDVEFASTGLCIDGDTISVDTVNSVAKIDGKEYWSKDLATKLLPDNKSVTTKDNTIYVGTVLADSTDLLRQYINSQSNCKLTDSITDSYGNTHANALKFYGSGGASTVFVLNRKYSYLKFSFAVCDDANANGMNFTVKADDAVVYTSDSVNKQTEPFPVEGIAINNCTLLTIECNGRGFIYDAVVYN